MFLACLSTLLVGLNGENSHLACFLFRIGWTILVDLKEDCFKGLGMLRITLFYVTPLVCFFGKFRGRVLILSPLLPDFLLKLVRTISPILLLSVATGHESTRLLFQIFFSISLNLGRTICNSSFLLTLGLVSLILGLETDFLGRSLPTTLGRNLLILVV